MTTEGRVEPVNSLARENRRHIKQESRFLSLPVADYKISNNICYTTLDASAADTTTTTIESEAINSQYDRCRVILYNL